MSNKTKIWRYLFAVLLGGLLGACHSEGSTVSRLAVSDAASELVPADAFDRRDEAGAPWVQISFSVRRKPLEFAVNVQSAVANGWQICRPKSPEWVGYEDASQAGTRYTQHIKYLFYKAGIQVIAVGTYYSESERSAVRQNGDPPMPVQHVFLVAGQATDQQARTEATEQSLVCE
jgi:hypothetical protein